MNKEKSNGSTESNQHRYKNALPAFRATLTWIEGILGVSLRLSESYRGLFVTGETLCSLLNAIVPGAIKRINRCPNRASAADNLTLFLSACEEKCGIPQSTLFSVDDFDDMFDRKTETYPPEEKNIQAAEKVAISLFWLARFTDQDPSCAHLPKLNYSAFSGILPRSLIQNSLLGCVGDGITSRFLARKQQSEDCPSNGIVDSKSPVNIERHIQPHQFIQPSQSSMGNADSVPSRVNHDTIRTVKLPEMDRPSSCSSALPEADRSTPQANNNGLEDDAWQDDLDAWRERRRRASRMHATKMTSLEEAREAEEKRKQEAIRDRMRQIKSQRSFSSGYYIPSTDIVCPVPPSSPGMALLTGGCGVNVFEFSEDFSPVESENRQIDIGTRKDPQEALEHEVEPTVSSNPETSHRLTPVPKPEDADENLAASGLHSQSLSGHKSDDLRVDLLHTDEVKCDPPAPQHIDEFEPNVPHMELLDVGETASDTVGPELQVVNDNKKSVLSAKYSMSFPSPRVSPQPSEPPSENPVMVRTISPGEYREVKIRVKSVMKTLDARWGLTIRADGPMQTAPFVVERVKIGSAADVCDVNKGDIILQVNETILNVFAPSPSNSINLATLEDLLDQLSSENNALDLRVLRKRSQNDDFSDADGDQESAAEQSLLTRDSAGSDVDEVHGHSCQRAVVKPNHRKSLELSAESDHSLVVCSGTPTNNGQISQTWNFENGRTRNSENHPMEINLRNPLSTRIVDHSEVGATVIQTASQTDDATYPGTSQVISHHESTDIQPNHVTMVSESIPEEQPYHTISIAQPTVENAVLEFHPCKQFQGDISPVLSDLSEINQQQLESPTIHTSFPPTTIPPCNGVDICTVTLPSACYGVQSKATDDSSSIIPRRIQDKERAHTLPIPYLPSPPSPTFLEEFGESDISDNRTQFPRMNLTELNINRPSASITTAKQSHLFRSKEMLSKGYTVSSPSIPRCLPDTLHPGNPVSSVMHKTTNRQRSFEITRQNSPPPPPSAPLLSKNGPNFPNSIRIETPTDLQNGISDRRSREEALHVLEVGPRRSYAPPPPPPNKLEAPPQPPRVPLNRGIDPKGKCTACTQELGTGDLMIIGSMNLCYHLACFVCSLCGVPLSDGLSNADVRIRMGQLYCQPCYPSRHGHKTAPQGDATRRKSTQDRSGTLSNRSPAPLTCSDRRVRARCPSNQSRRSQPGTKPPTYL